MKTANITAGDSQQNTYWRYGRCQVLLKALHTSIPAASATNGLADSGAQATSSTTCSWSRRSHLHSFVATTHTRIVCKVEY